MSKNPTSPIQSPISPSKPSPLTSTSMKSSHQTQDLSTSDLMERIPTPILRLLSITEPLIDLVHSFIHLLTWNDGNSKSILLLLSYWTVCLLSYEVLRFFPQLLLLSFISYRGLVKFYSSASKRSNLNSRKVVTDRSLNQTLDKLTEITDFFSILKSNLIEPVYDLLCWKNNRVTKKFTIFLITTWPLWLICFLPLHGGVFGNLIPSLWFRFQFSWIRNLAYWSWEKFSLILEELEIKSKVSNFFYSKAPQLMAYFILFSNKLSDFYHSNLFQETLEFFSICYRFLISALFVRHSANSSLSIPLIPPFPFFSLALRHFFLISGTLILTYCSPWSALIRHSLWKSALIRRSTRAFIHVFTLDLHSFHQGGNQNHDRYQDEIDLFGLKENYRYKAFDEDEIRELDGSNEKKNKPQSALEKQKESKITRHEDVIYQFSIFENQRWWMGLDWTAALLPQERPSWSDESNNPVLPPSSFSLPNAKISITPSTTNATSSNGKRLFNRRLVKWQWIDPEWTVSGVGFVSSTSNSNYLGDSLRMRATSSRNAEKTLFSNSQKSDDSSVTGSSASDREDFINSENQELSVDILDVDHEGWQYGDNSWEKLSKKSGMGKYTRRRKWVRRAVLLDILERDVELTEAELRNYERETGLVEQGEISGGNDQEKEMEHEEDEGEETETEEEKEDQIKDAIDSNLDPSPASKSNENEVTNLNVSAVGLGNSGLNGGNEKRASEDLQARLARLTK